MDQCPLCQASISILLPVTLTTELMGGDDDQTDLVAAMPPFNGVHSTMNFGTETFPDRLNNFKSPSLIIDFPWAEMLLYRLIVTQAPLLEIIQQNCRQAVALQGTPEYSGIVRIGRLLCSYLLSLQFAGNDQKLCSPQVWSLFEAGRPPVFHFFALELLLNYTPTDRKIQTHLKVIDMIRTIALGFYKHQGQRQCLARSWSL